MLSYLTITCHIACNTLSHVYFFNVLGGVKFTYVIYIFNLECHDLELVDAVINSKTVDPVTFTEGIKISPHIFAFIKFSLSLFLYISSNDLCIREGLFGGRAADLAALRVWSVWNVQSSEERLHFPLQQTLVLNKTNPCFWRHSRNPSSLSHLTAGRLTWSCVGVCVWRQAWL